MQNFQLFLSFQIIAKYLSLEILTKTDYALVLPNIDNKITPFVIKSENQFDLDNKYRLRADCSRSVVDNLEFTVLTSELCTKEINYSYKEMNLFLEDLKVFLMNNDEALNMHIDFDFQYNNEFNNLSVYN